MIKTLTWSIAPYIIACCLVITQLHCAGNSETPIPVEDATPTEETSQKKIIVVPDQATYLFYLSKWTFTEKFPLFIGKSKYMQKFAAVYNNGENEIVYVDSRSVGSPSKNMVYQVVMAAQSEHDISAEPRDGLPGELKTFYRENNISPAGLILTNMESPEWPAAAALAAHHHQIVEFYEPPARPLLGYSKQSKEDVRTDVIAILDKWGFPYKGIGEGIDAITIALDIPYSYGGGFALDDAINRSEPNTKECFAYTGRLMDMGLGLAVYQAMCSIFLTTSRALFFDKWPQQWGRALDVGCWQLRSRIPCVSLRNDLKKWRAVTGNLNSYDLIFVNASGNPDGWSGGTVADIPDSLPVAVYFAHSSSAAKPFDKDTIAGSFLRNGAFVYYGAISEPYAASFNKSEHVLGKWVEGASFAHAAQQKETLLYQYARPWKLMYIGDPLFFARFDIHDADEQFYRTMKNAQESFEELAFSDAKNILRGYLVKEREMEDDIFYFEHARILLRKIYDFIFLENIIGIQIYKNNIQQFLLSWIADYPNAVGTKAELYKNEDALVAYYEKEFTAVEASLQKNTYYHSFWMSVMTEIRQRRWYPFQWRVIGPFREVNKTDKDNVTEAILNAVGNDAAEYNGAAFAWKTVQKDPLTNRLELSINSKSDSDMWGAYCTLNSEEDQTITLRYISGCFAKIYLDNQEIAVHNDTGSILNKTLRVTKGVHTIAVVFYPSRKKPVKISLRILDERFLPLQKINYIK